MAPDQTAQSDLEDETLRRAFERLTTSSLTDAQMGAELVATGLLRLSGTGTVAGRALTVRCTEGRPQAIGQAIAQAGPNSVLCITAPGEWPYIGGLSATAMTQRKLAAVVILANVRDSALLSASPVSFFVRGLNPVGYSGALSRDGGEIGETMVPLQMGEALVQPGDWIIADNDGVICIPAKDASRVAERATASAAREDKILALIADGVPIAEAFERIARQGS